MTRVCGCGNLPDETEGPDTGNYIDDDGSPAYICLNCWCFANYGQGYAETVSPSLDSSIAEHDLLTLQLKSLTIRS